MKIGRKFSLIAIAYVTMRVLISLTEFGLSNSLSLLHATVCLCIRSSDISLRKMRGEHKLVR